MGKPCWAGGKLALDGEGSARTGIHPDFGGPRQQCRDKLLQIVAIGLFQPLSICARDNRSPSRITGDTVDFCQVFRIQDINTYLEGCTTKHLPTTKTTLASGTVIRDRWERSIKWLWSNGVCDAGGWSGVVPVPTNCSGDHIT